MTHTVWNREQEIRFDGELLASGSSFQLGKTRWYEVELWRTIDDRYVVHKVGRSDVEDEHDRHSAIVADRPEGVVAALYSRRASGDYHLPLTAKLALEDAADKDSRLREAYLHRDLTPRTA